MKAAVLHGSGDVRIEDLETPEPTAGEVLLDIELALTGGTTLKMVRRGYHARLGDPPLRLGHEGVGVITALGEGVEGFALGDRVVPANSGSCGMCPACERGLSAQCASMVWLTGTCAEQVVVPALIVRTNLHKVPEGVDPRAAALAENVACVLKGRDRSPGRAGERALVLGAGAMGLIWTRVLSLTGVEVTTVDPLPDRRNLALQMGATLALEPGELDEHLDAGTLQADVVVEVVGDPAVWETAIRAAAPGGRVHLFGGPARDTSIRLDTQRMHYDELTLVSSFHHTPYHFAEAVRAMAAGLLDPSALVREEVALDDLPDFFRRHLAGGGPTKAAVRP